MNPHPPDDLLADEARIFGLFADATTSLDLDGQLLLARLNEQLFQTPRDTAIRLGRYHVERLLGEGGMGRVYLARDPKTKGLLAVKVLRFSGLSPEVRARAQRVLRREAHLMANLRAHPNIVVIYDIDETDDQVAVAMQYIEGGDLRAWQRSRSRSGHTRWREIVDMYRAVARGLAHAHLNGIVHGDFKPDNVLVDVRDAPHITDFGLARSLEVVDSEDLDRSESIGAAGTPEYMAPELFDHHRIDHASAPSSNHSSNQASDQFSFCVALFEALLGTHPYATATYGDLAQTLRSSGREVSEELVRARYVTDLVKAMHRGALRWPRPAKQLPAWLRAVLTRGLQIGPDKRFASMTELLTAVEHGIRGAQIRKVGLAALALVTAGALVGVLWARDNRVARCEAAGAAIDAVWNDHERAVIREKFSDDSPPVLAAADHYATSWKRIASELCRRTNFVGDQSPALMDTRMACLDMGRHEFTALRESIKKIADSNAALDNLARLAAPEACAEATGIHPLPQDPDRLAALERFRGSSASAFAAEVSEQYTDALRQADAALAAARASAYPPALVQAYLRRGRIGVRASLYAKDIPNPAALRAPAEADLKTAYMLGMTEDPRTGADAYVFLQRFLARIGEGDAAILGDVARMTPLVTLDESATFDLSGFSHRLGLGLERRATYLESSGIFHERRSSYHDDPAFDRSAERSRLFARTRRDYFEALELRRLLAGVRPPIDDPEAAKRRASDHTMLLENAANASVQAANESLIFGESTDLAAADALLRDAESAYEEALQLTRGVLAGSPESARRLTLALADIDESRWRAASRRAAEGSGAAAEVDASRRAIDRRIAEAARLGEDRTVLLRRARATFLHDLARADELAATVVHDQDATPLERCAGLELLATVHSAQGHRDPGAARPEALQRDIDAFAAACPGPLYRASGATFRARLHLLRDHPEAAREALVGALATERLYPDARFYASLDLVQAELQLVQRDPTRDRDALASALTRAEAALQRARHELPAELDFAWGTRALADRRLALEAPRPGEQ